MKNKLIAGNWKMNGSLAANDALVSALIGGVSTASAQVAVCVPEVVIGYRQPATQWCLPHQYTQYGQHQQKGQHND